MDPKTPLALALSTLVAAALLLPSAAATRLPDDPLPPPLPAGDLLRVDVSYADGLLTVSNDAVECVSLDDPAGTEITCVLGDVGRRVRCVEVWAELDIFLGSGHVKSSCPTLAAECSGAGAFYQCYDQAYGSSPLPWACTGSGIGLFSFSCGAAFG